MPNTLSFFANYSLHPTADVIFDFGNFEATESNEDATTLASVIPEIFDFLRAKIAVPN